MTVWNKGLTTLEREDPILGVVRLCFSCEEEWPRDDEFFYFDRTGKVVGRCRACWVEFNKERRKAKDQRYDAKRRARRLAARA